MAYVAHLIVINLKMLSISTFKLSFIIQLIFHWSLLLIIILLNYYLFLLFTSVEPGSLLKSAANPFTSEGPH